MKGVIVEEFGAGQTSTELYPVSGGSDDWARGALGIKYVIANSLAETRECLRIRRCYIK